MSAQILALLESVQNSAQVLESLELSGHLVMRCKSFRDAISILEGVQQVDLIVSDVHLENGGNIFDFMRWVRDNPTTAEVPFVLLSCNPSPLAKYLEDGTRTTARLLGANKYISMETFNPALFRSEIDTLLESELAKISVRAKKDKL